MIYIIYIYRYIHIIEIYSIISYPFHRLNSNHVLDVGKLVKRLSWVVPPLPGCNRGKWRFRLGSPTKNVIILVVTGILGGGTTQWPLDSNCQVLLQWGDGSFRVDGRCMRVGWRISEVLCGYPGCSIALLHWENYDPNVLALELCPSF